MVNFKSYINC